MNKLSLRYPCLLLLFFLLFSVSSHAQQERFEMTQLGPDNFLKIPWDLHYGPDEFLWVTERKTGKVLRVNPETGALDVLVTVPGVFSSAAQDGLLGIALSDDILGATPYVYLSYTYQANDERQQRLVRYTYSINAGDGSLADPVTLIEGLPASNDHNSGRLIIGPDDKLYYTIGDQGNNQNRNYCNPILAQVLPTQEEIDAKDWHNYPGKILRLNKDGSIPNDNPLMNGVRSHIYTYGHRNPQGLIFGSDGQLYADEHGPNTDDEVNLIEAGKNYGWPIVVGYQDDQGYDYCDWSSLPDCAAETYVNGFCPEGATLVEERSLLDTNYRDPLLSMFAVSDDYDYDNPACQNAYTCRPNVAPSSLAIYESDGIPGWKNSLLVTSLKRGKVYRLQLAEDGQRITGDTIQYFYSGNRYRDIAVSPDGKTFYLLTDASGNITDGSGLNLLSRVRNPGTILKFTLDESVSTPAEPAEDVFRLWPNPATQNLFVELKSPVTQDFRAELINAKGQTVALPATLYPGVNSLPIGQLPAGVYIFRLAGKGAFWHQRVVVF